MKQMRDNTEAQLAGINIGKDLWENVAKVMPISNISSGEIDCITENSN